MKPYLLISGLILCAAAGVILLETALLVSGGEAKMHVLSIALIALVSLA
jgi:hypothetical protein